jgi:hypothetical protein
MNEELKAQKVLQVRRPLTTDTTAAYPSWLFMAYAYALRDTQTALSTAYALCQPDRIQTR